jgi:hypothetical protein
VNLLFRTSHGCLASRERKRDQASDGRRPIYRCHQQQHLTCPSPKKIPLKQVSRVDRPSFYSIFNASNLETRIRSLISLRNKLPIIKWRPFLEMFQKLQMSTANWRNCRSLRYAKSRAPEKSLQLPSEILQSVPQLS